MSDFKWFSIALIGVFLTIALISFAPTPEKDLLYTCMRFENMMYVDGNCIPQTNEGITE
jgi:hypothetical protein